MPMDSFQKFALPVGLFASIATVYLLFRNSDPSPTTAVVPNPSSAGVTGPYSSQGVVAPVSYDVPAIPTVGPANIIDLGATGQMPFQPAPVAVAGAPGPSYSKVLKAPASATPRNPNQRTPGYLAYNFVPIDAPFVAAQPSGGCGGGCSGCSQKDDCGCGQPNGYVDGPGKTRLSGSRVAQVVNSHPDKWLETQAGNLMSYLALEQPDSIPTLTSNPRTGRL